MMSGTALSSVIVKGKKYIGLRTSFDNREKCKTVPGYRWKKERKMWLYPWSSFSAFALLTLFSGAEVSDSVQELLELYHRKVNVNAIKYQDQVIMDVPEDMWQHQKRCLSWMLQSGHGGYLLALDMGTGKSRIIVDFMRARGLGKTCIVGPLAVVPSWERQFDMFYPDVYVVSAVNMPTAKRQNVIMDGLGMAGAMNRPCVVLINYQSVWRDGLRDVIKGIEWDMVVADECQHIRSAGSKVSRFFGEFYAVRYRMGLSGTPLGNDCLDAYGIFRFLDAGIFGTSNKLFKARYAIFDQNGWKPFTYINQEEFSARFHAITYRVSKQEALPFLPEYQHVEVPLEMNAKSMKVYQEVEANLVAEIEKGEVTVSNALTRLLRLQQVTSGYLPDDDGETLHHINDAKKDALRDIMGGISCEVPVVVFARFRHDLDNIREVAGELGRDCMELRGGKHEWYDWQFNRTGGEVLGVQIQSGGAGVDLTRAQYCIFYSVGFSYDQYDQALSRIHRPGQTRKVTYYHLVVKNTVDVKVYRALRKKQDVVKSILEAWQ